ncbi:MAG TPA: NADH-quinone oxidoreductase subunit L, partial [Methylotenera sp.]|nr:NADH-quinone oxidoreductase subunit L [Methylotenera sp.]
ADIQTGIFALVGMGLMYFALAAIQVYPKQLAIFQRWSYAGFYVDEAYTRLTLKLWPVDWGAAETLPAKS